MGQDHILFELGQKLCQEALIGPEHTGHGQKGDKVEAIDPAHPDPDLLAAAHNQLPDQLAARAFGSVKLAGTFGTVSVAGGAIVAPAEGAVAVAGKMPPGEGEDAFFSASR